MAGSTNIALVTGASGGIGLEIARLLADRGHDLFLVARSADRLDDIARQFEKDFGIRVEYLAVDLTSPDAPDQIEEAVASNGLHVEMLVNNAGVGLLGLFHQGNRVEQMDMIRLNVLALADLTHRFLGPMVERRRGWILNVGSISSFSAGPFMSGYHASKAFVLSLSEGLALELRGTGVSVTALCPGPVRTGFQNRAGIPEDSIQSAAVVSARRVAKAGLDGLLAGKTVVVPGALNRVLTVLAQIMPRKLVTATAYKIQVSRQNRRS